MIDFTQIKIRTLLIDTAVVLLGILAAVGIFVVLKNYQDQKERESLVPRAVDALNKSEYSKAIFLFKQAETEFPESNDVKRYLGNLYFLKGKYDDALAYYSKVDIGLLNDYEVEDLGEIYYMEEQYDKALSTWENRTLSKENQYKYARIFYEKDQFDRYYAELSKINTYQEPLLLLQIRETNLQSVLANVEKARSLPSVTTETINVDLFSSQITESKKQSDAGKKEYSELIQIAAYGNLNECRILFGRIDSLKTTLESKKLPVYQADYYKGYCFNQINKPDEAMPLIESAIKADTTLIEYRESLARSKYLKGDIEGVKSVYNDIFVLEKKPQYYENLAIYLYKSEKFDDAVSSYESALSLNQQITERRRYARSILQIKLIHQQDLNVCSRKELIDILDSNVADDYIISGQCKIYTDNNLEGIEERNSLTYEYLTALLKKDQDIINSVLDRDIDGIITTYYRAIGDKIVKRS